MIGYHRHDQDDNADNDNHSNSSDNDDGKSAIDHSDELRAREQQRLLTEIAQSAQDASDELRLMNENIQDLAREVQGTKESIKSLTEMLRKYLDNRNQDKASNNKDK
jgi:methyl-accepting chemotaxis protein